MRQLLSAPNQSLSLYNKNDFAENYSNPKGIISYLPDEYYSL